jgi:hypothetical protein
MEEDLLTINLSDISVMDEEKNEDVVETPAEATEVAEEIKPEDQATDTEATVEEAIEEVDAEAIEEDLSEVTEEVETEEIAEEKVDDGKVELSELEILKKQLLEVNEENSRLRSIDRVKDAEIRFSDLLKDGKVLPVQKDAFIAIYSTPEVFVEFSDSDEKVGLKEAFDKFTASMPKIINLSEDGAVIDEEKSESRPHFIELRESHAEMNDEEFETWYAEHQEVLIDELGE